MAHGYERAYIYREIRSVNRKGGLRKVQEELGKLKYTARVSRSHVEITLWEYEWWVGWGGPSHRGNIGPVPLHLEELLNLEVTAKLAGVVFNPKSCWILDYVRK